MSRLARTFVVVLVALLMGVAPVVPVAAASGSVGGRIVISQGIFDGGGSTG